MNAPEETLRAIAQAVAEAGGDQSDFDDLVECWERLAADSHGRVDRMRAQALTVQCCCGNGGEPRGDSRCGRCWGYLVETP